MKFGTMNTHCMARKTITIMEIAETIPDTVFAKESVC